MRGCWAEFGMRSRGIDESGSLKFVSAFLGTLDDPAAEIPLKW